MEASEGQLTAADVKGWSPLRFAEETGAWTWVERFLQGGTPLKHLESTRRMLKSVDSAADIIRTACAASLLQLLQFVLSVDSSLANVKLDTEGTTPLHVAAAHQRLAVVCVLLDAGADVGSKTNRGRSALHTAAAVGAEKVVHILLESGAQMWELDREGKSAVQLAKEEGHLGLARVMEIRGGNVQLGLWRMVIAGSAGDVEAVRKLLPLLPPKEPGEWTDLHWAMIRGNPNLVRTYLAAGMDPNVSDSHGNTPLHVAAARRPPAVSAALIDAGADIDAADSTGSTALHYAVRTGNVDTVRLLLKSGARHDVRNSDGKTPLHHAVSRGSLEAVNSLLEAGVRRDNKDAREETPYDLARRFGYTDILRMLRLTPCAGTPMPATSHSCSDTATCCQYCASHYD
ncbi:ankyrin-1-like [Schistocerca piceifrons]|uniref:ankyrin-1-like n=1 Tax=Schistocerca piceifrons TaxID=274613 RepID=UPI001F5FC5BD|nr:ankyrin-1-like [Schistocerca piceifrons]